MNTASVTGSVATVYSRAPGPADQTAGEQHLDLPFRQGVTCREGAAPGCIPDLNLAVPADLLVQIPQLRNVTQLQPVVLNLIVQREWQDAEVHQILPVDARESLSDDDP